MQNLMRRLLARLERRRVHPAPTVTYWPRQPQQPSRPPRTLRRRPESPLDGEAGLLVRPYLLAHERQEVRRERTFLCAMAVAS
ncbi:hypothetical protein SAMN05428945_1519 [Streptomyces sp. 2224.1]|uniref:hypothetical protein n=1 Tax=Streptomyces sp. 2224.1 TaxID=1881020 RepID=UPI00089CE563|nr:hypothetical protein [Streptomyces sp. 2224.1]SEB91468.1 hypothetical protein SAMN05428945_1519 [Streptomyces sp. 2224.1]